MKTLYIGLCLGSLTMLMGASTATDRSAKPARILREIKSDATLVREAATHWNNQAEGTNPTWTGYDQQWNFIKPLVEDMQMKLGQLEAMQSSLSSAQSTELNQIKPLVAEIQSRTHELLVLLDRPGIQTNDANFKMYARSLRNEARKLETIVPAS